MWAEHTKDMNHQVHIQHAQSICIACTVGYHCYLEALHNLYKHTPNTNGLGAPHPPPRQNNACGHPVCIGSMSSSPHIVCCGSCYNTKK